MTFIGSLIILIWIIKAFSIRKKLLSTCYLYVCLSVCLSVRPSLFSELYNSAFSELYYYMRWSEAYGTRILIMEKLFFAFFFIVFQHRKIPSKMHSSSFLWNYFYRFLFISEFYPKFKNSPNSWNSQEIRKFKLITRKLIHFTYRVT
jgi:hypothetical protein